MNDVLKSALHHKKAQPGRLVMHAAMLQRLEPVFLLFWRLQKNKGVFVPIGPKPKVEEDLP